MDKLIDIATKYKCTDKGTLHSYLDVYDELFSPFRDKSVNVFEVGYRENGSSEMFADYFCKGIIRAIDINKKIPRPQHPRITLDIISIRNLRKDYFNNFIPDIAIDDGSHELEEQLIFVKLLFPIVRRGGILIVEDVQDINKLDGFKELGFPFDVVDLRDKKGRYDDVLLVYKK